MLTHGCSINVHLPALLGAHQCPAKGCTWIGADFVGTEMTMVKQWGVPAWQGDTEAEGKPTTCRNCLY